ncbi:hypothetical protein [Paracoccus sp. SCSIO 75233]|uniref:hypothetical protein n=1 Tax=Paracoccus sp. SCSIO 75233 TaxID=3017782 RepID=UPI0022F00544|nr:hypothetical protein [Paracoccus sp. SCSIO 75233]WBU52223.1 hypothetical protein PAF12_10290 [Paracoccus sp. SCSIO 75233]
MNFSLTRVSVAAIAVAATLALGACATMTTPASESYTTTTLLTEDAKQSLEARVNAFDRDLTQGNMASVVEYLPPKMIDMLAEEVGAPPEFLKAAVGSMIEGMTQEIDIVGYSDISQALVGTTSTGMPYALIPGAARFTAGGETFTDQSTTLALMDEGEWYLVGLSDAETVEDVREAYPEFRTVTLPSG